VIVFENGCAGGIITRLTTFACHLFGKMLPDGRLEEGKEYKMRNASSLPEKVRRREKSLIFRLIDEE
jgi:hypothetical protein